MSAVGTGSKKLYFNTYEVDKKKLSNGCEFKNWRTLCNEMGWKFATGNTRKAQFKALNTVCKWHTEGYKVVIDEVFNIFKPRERKLSPVVQLRQAVEKQIVRELYEYRCKVSSDSKWIYENSNPQASMIVSKSELMQRLGLANSNTNVAYGNQGVVSNMLKLNYDMFLDVYDSNRQNAKNTLDTALRCLKSIITTRDVFELVIEEGDQNTIDSTTGEVTTREFLIISDNNQYDFIKNTAYNVILEQYGLSDIRQLYVDKPQLIHQFFYDVNSWIRVNCDEEEYINYYGNSITKLSGLKAHFPKLQLSFDNKFITKRHIRNGVLTDAELQLIENNAIDYYKFKIDERSFIADMNCKRNETNAKNRHKRAVNCNNESDFRFKHKVRQSSEYLDVASVTNNIFHANKPIALINQSDVSSHRSAINNFGISSKKEFRATSSNDGLGKLLESLKDNCSNEQAQLIEEIFSQIDDTTIEYEESIVITKENFDAISNVLKLFKEHCPNINIKKVKYCNDDTLDVVEFEEKKPFDYNVSDLLDGVL